MHKALPSKSNFSLALVTGASSGIGAALCRLLANKRIPLLMTGRDSVRLHLLAEELQHLVPVTQLAADLSKADERQTLLNAMRARTPDLVINNAGFGLYGEALSYNFADHLDLLHVNGTCVVELTLEAARTLISKEKKGVILNVSSAAGMLTFPMFASYSASKALVTQFSRSFDYEVAPYGVRVLTACPGVVATAFRKRAAKNASMERSGSSMSAACAAQLIWQQILKRKSLSVFNWKTRLAVLFARLLLPDQWIARFLSNEIKKIAPSPSLKL